MSEREAEFNSYKLSSIQSLADVGLKFKKEYADDERALKYFKDGARDDAMKMGKPEIKEIDGKAEIIFRDEEGNVVTDSDNLMKPLTYSSVYRRNLSNVLAESKPQGGTGGKGGTNDNIVFGGYKSKKELSEHIRTYLASKNLHSTDITGKYQQEFDKLYAEHNTADLPMG